MHVMLHMHTFLNLVQEQKPSGPIKCKKFASLSNHQLLNTLRMGDADLRLYITTVQDG